MLMPLHQHTHTHTYVYSHTHNGVFPNTIETHWCEANGIGLVVSFPESKLFSLFLSFILLFLFSLPHLPFPPTPFLFSLIINTLSHWKETVIDVCLLMNSHTDTSFNHLTRWRIRQSQWSWNSEEHDGMLPYISFSSCKCIQTMQRQYMHAHGALSIQYFQIHYRDQID